jgi:signal transduction histidine kinase
MSGHRLGGGRREGVRAGEQRVHAGSSILRVRRVARRLHRGIGGDTGIDVPLERDARSGHGHEPGRGAKDAASHRDGRATAPRGGGAALHRRTRQLLAAQDEERRRIARELHDGTAATLVALSLDLTRVLESLGPGEPLDLAAECASLCEQSLRELRAATFVLHPPLLEREGLAVALRWLADGFARRSGIQVTFEAGAGTRGRPSPDVELTLYRVAQEALTNVLRHSGSPTAHVTLRTRAGQLRLTVCDEGRACSRRRRTARGGVGVTSMGERVRVLGGWLTLAFRRSGTVLTAVVPLT